MKSEMTKLMWLTKRNIKLYFKDKTIFFVSLITPMVMIVLFLTFLGNVYKDSLVSSLPEGMVISDSIINAFTGGWLFSSIIAASCITVAFCSNMMAYDKVNKVNLDYMISPVSNTTLKISYVLSNFVTTMIICFASLVISFIYLAIVGWYLSFGAVVMILIDMLLLIAFGTLLSSIIGYAISNQGAQSAVSSMVSSMYGFLCGAYMPISQFSAGIQAVISFMPGTYGTVLLRNYFLGGVLDELAKEVPKDVLAVIRKSFDGSFEFFGNNVEPWVMFLVLGLSCLALLGIFALVSYVGGGHRAKRPLHISENK